MSYQIEGDEWVTYDGVPSDTPAWRTLNLWELWQGPDTRGEDRLIPGTAGVRAYRRRATVTFVDVEMEFFGNLDWDGAEYTDARVGLETNLLHWRTNVTDPTVAAPGTRTAVLHLPSGATKTGAVTVESFKVQGDGPAAANAVMRLSIKAGALA